MANVASSYPTVFGGGGRTKQHSAAYREFGETWSYQKIIYEMADEKITQIPQVYETYLNDAMAFLTYLIKKQEMEDEEEKFQDTLRQMKRGR